MKRPEIRDSPPREPLLTPRGKIVIPIVVVLTVVGMATVVISMRSMDRCTKLQLVYDVHRFDKNEDGIRQAKARIDEVCVEVVGEDGKVRLEAK